jgi:predicted acyl esterase
MKKRMVEFKSEIRDGMRIDWDAPIAMEDGVTLRVDVFRPVGDGRYPRPVRKLRRSRITR